ncbi:MAG: type II toxin-antitoxin system RelB family antitoxin [Allorhizobium sp.]
MNKHVNIEIPDKAYQLIADQAVKTGTGTDADSLELIEQHLEDIQDLAAGEATMDRINAGESRTHMLEEVKRELGLDD